MTLAIKVVNGGLRAAHFFTIHAQRLVFAAGLMGLALSMTFHIRHLFHIQSVRSAAGRVQGAIVEMESSQRGYLLFNPTTPANEAAAAPFLDKYALYRKLLSERLEDLCQVIPDNPENDRICRTIETLIYAKLAEMDRTILLSQHGDHAAALRLFDDGSGREMENEIERKLDQIRLREGTTYHPVRACLIP